MERKLKPCRALRGEVSLPGDKSISHRAVILNSIAAGKATVENFSPGKDCLSSVACLRALGVAIEVYPGERRLIISGVGGDGLKEPQDILDAGNSGTTMRLLSGLLAGQPFFSVITGDSSLRSRPMGRIIDPLRQMGAQIWGRRGDAVAPLAIRGGHLQGIRYRLPVPSAQLKSAIVLAALFAEGNTVVEEPVASRDHTERLLKAMGAPLVTSNSEIVVAPGPLRAVDLRVPGDISSAAYWLVAACVHPDAKVQVKNVGMNPTRTGIVDVLKSMGARITISNERTEGGEPVADLLAETSELAAVEIGGDLVPRAIDELPIIAVAAAVAKGATVIRDAAELRVKESDRIATVVRELSRLGADIEERPDGMAIRGGRRLQGETCSSYNDHRLAMTLAIASQIAQGETTIADAEAVDISYPGFWQELERLCST
ncbi:MAG: 3-phosphoshikimate 1-carboxyvinyltransferase [Chloroflexi bacterium]|nr:3-phosphoshikimate 1-carboxyvinyltransferase [Chloroflexota bacterium]